VLLPWPTVQPAPADAAAQRHARDRARRAVGEAERVLDAQALRAAIARIGAREAVATIDRTLDRIPPAGKASPRPHAAPRTAEPARADSAPPRELAGVPAAVLGLAADVVGAVVGRHARRMNAELQRLESRLEATEGRVVLAERGFGSAAMFGVVRKRLEPR